MQYELISTLLKRIFYKVKYESKFSNLQARKPVGKILCDMKFNGFQQFNCLGGKILFWKKTTLKVNWALVSSAIQAIGSESYQDVDNKQSYFALKSYCAF